MEVRLDSPPSPPGGGGGAMRRSAGSSAGFRSKLEALCSLACERASRVTEHATSRAGVDGGGGEGGGGDACAEGGAAREGRSGSDGGKTVGDGGRGSYIGGVGGEGTCGGGGHDARGSGGGGGGGGGADKGPGDGNPRRGEGCLVGGGGHGGRGRFSEALGTGRGGGDVGIAGGAVLLLVSKAGGGSCGPSQASPATPQPPPAVPAARRWYTRDPHGIYHCLLCSYTCERQRTLKTHAWKHAREVTCTYPVFEELEDGGGGGCGGDGVNVGTPLAAASNGTVRLPDTDADSNAARGHVHPSEGGSVNATSLLTPGPPKSAEADARERSAAASTPGRSDEAQVPGLPGLAAGTEQGARRSPGPNVGLDAAAAGLGDESGATPRLPMTVKAHDIGCGARQDEQQGLWKKNSSQVGALGVKADEQERSQQQQEREDCADVRPVSRRRTNSECLRLHSLAAEALVALPAWLPPPPPPRHPDPPSPPHQDLGVQEPIHEGACSDSYSSSSSSRGSGSQSGISTLLLSVIERLHQRDEGDGEVGAATAREGGPRRVKVEDMEIDDVEQQPEEEEENELEDEHQQRALLFGGLVEQVSGTRHAYRCRVCPYRGTSAAHARQHLRAHRRPRPYQCPICHEVARDCGALREHTARHCRPRPHRCSHCPFDFHYKSQLRNHEREHHNVAPRRRAVAGKHAASPAGHGQGARERRLHQCDMCSYTSVSYVGVRNHRRIHDKSYRCAECEFTTSSAAAFKQHSCAHNALAVSAAEPFRCVLCGYVCSFAASLKAHMWRHASDQNYDFQRVNRDIDAATALAQRFQNRTVLKMAPAPGESGRPPSSPGTVGDNLNPAPPDGHSPNPVTGNAVATSAVAVGKPARSASEKPAAPVTPATLAAAVQTAPPLFLTLPRSPVLGGTSRPQAPQGKSCRLTFCCCVCGFESGVREELLAHMQGHQQEFLPAVRSGQPQQQQHVQP
ncbi:LOW QUALITY PROTEIN: zinc finger protein 507 [Lethenteron reissneri]|uniref:LOW QUALITY PROTEIN: zinc finger protein 507 n=1 Tax=Lethenteron reissneri TaxID=7753 RepID=UPI002AB7008D|nr:LOW QUALITY PROTEIN: zinc finger protein 507 [Lethenteron reissneri]